MGRDLCALIRGQFTVRIIDERVGKFRTRRHLICIVIHQLTPRTLSLLQQASSRQAPALAGVGRTTTTLSAQPALAGFKERGLKPRTKAGLSRLEFNFSYAFIARPEGRA